MSDRQETRLTRNLFYSTLSAGSAALMLGLLVLVGRELSVDDYGTFSYAVAVATVAEVFMDFGLHQITIRAIARDASRAGDLLQTSLLLKVLPGAAMVAVFGAAVFVLRHDPIVRLACILMLASAVMRSYLLTARGILQGLERFGHDAIVTTADRLLLLAACGIALWRGASVIQVCLVFLIARAASAGGALLLARSHAGRGGFDRGLWRRLPAEALPVGLFLLVLNLYNRVDTLMLGSFKGDYDTGIYNAAYPLYEGLTYVTAVISSVLVPRLSRLWTADRPAYQALVMRSLAASTGLGMLVGVAAWPLSGLAVHLLWGAPYGDAALTLRLLLLGLPFVYAIWVLHSVAIAAHETRVLVIVTAVGSVFNVILNAILIPRYTYNGSAVATVISEVVATCALAYGLRGVLRVPGPAASSMPETRAGD
jgi:O-antigen/teichoic acid export membrane protein